MPHQNTITCLYIAKVYFTHNLQVLVGLRTTPTLPFMAHYDTRTTAFRRNTHQIINEIMPGPQVVPGSYATLNNSLAIYPTKTRWKSLHQRTAGGYHLLYSEVGRT